MKIKDLFLSYAYIFNFLLDLSTSWFTKDTFIIELSDTASVDKYFTGCVCVREREREKEKVNHTFKFCNDKPEHLTFCLFC